MSSSRDNRQDVTLTTLVDLLVQIVFIFTLILIASGAVEGEPEERGYVAPEIWKTLISIFDLDTKKTPQEQIAEIKSKYKTALEERGSLRKNIDELDALIVELEKKAGAPGFPPCRAKDGREEYVLAANIDAAGRISTNLPAGVNALESSGLAFGVVKKILSRREFQQEFSVWHKHGLSRGPQCKYIATVEYDPKAAAGDYQPAISTISSIFKIKTITKQGER